MTTTPQNPDTFALKLSRQVQAYEQDKPVGRRISYPHQQTEGAADRGKLPDLTLKPLLGGGKSLRLALADQLLKDRQDGPGGVGRQLRVGTFGLNDHHLRAPSRAGRKLEGKAPRKGEVKPGGDFTPEPLAPDQLDLRIGRNGYGACGR